MSNTTATNTTMEMVDQNDGNDEHERDHEHHHVDPIYIYSHVIGGGLYLVIALIMAVLCYVRLRTLASSIGGGGVGKSPTSDNNNLSRLQAEYGKQYFPEPSSCVLRGIGWYFTGTSILGYMILTITEIPYGMSLFEDTFHMMVYFLFGSFGVINLLEANGRKVPKDSSRVTFALNLALEGLLLMVHSQKKHSENAVLQHQLIALTAFLSSIGLFLSILYPHNLIPYVVYLASFIWQSIWWITIGLCFLVQDLDTEDIAVYFSLEGMILFFVTLWLAANLQKQMEMSSSGSTTTADTTTTTTKASQQQRKARDERIALV